ncbi:maestro heat-like repeat-containing protein family member 7 [Athene noctua]
MKTVVGRNTKKMVEKVQGVVLPLFFHTNEQIESVAKASWDTLRASAEFLGWRRLSFLAETEQAHQIRECLITHKRNSVDEYLRQSLPYVENPQATVREAAVRFIGLAARHQRILRLEKLWDICHTLQSLGKDAEFSIRSLAAQTVLILTALKQKPSPAQSPPRPAERQPIGCCGGKRRQSALGVPCPIPAPLSAERRESSEGRAPPLAPGRGRGHLRSREFCGAEERVHSQREFSAACGFPGFKLFADEDSQETRV